MISFLINRTELDLLHSHLSDSATISCLSEKKVNHDTHMRQPSAFYSE